MRDLVYFMPCVLASIDQHLLDANYQHHRWFRISNSKGQHGVRFPVFYSSRVHRIATPWPIATTSSPIPTVTQVDPNINNVFDSVAENLVKSALVSNKDVYLLWSGGIDSTAILVALLRNNNREFLKRLTVVHSNDSIRENAYFYRYFIHGQIRTVDIADFLITGENYKNMLLLDGDAGNQVFGCATIYNLYYRQPDLLNQPWNQVSNLVDIIAGGSELVLDLLQESVAHAPFEISTVYDLLWWSNYNFKWDEVLHRAMYYYTQHLSPAQSRDFFKNNLFRFFEDADIQRWAIVYREQRRELAQLHPKWPVKNYIYQFDKNDLWFANKQEAPSGSKQTRATPIYRSTTVIGFDCEWNPVDLADSSTRQELGRLLERI